MMVSDLPEQDRFKLLAVGMFMSADGGRARPGNAGLAEFGPHADTWKKLLQRAVKAGWLMLVQRGGARRGPGGTTVRKASVYAASVPYAVWIVREQILAEAPYRSASAADEPPLKEAPGDPMKGASGTPFNGVAPPNAPVEGVFEGGIQRFEGGAAVPPIT